MSTENIEDANRRAEQLALNTRWLIERIDEIHAALCPGERGTWQQRAEQAVRAAKQTANQPKEP